MKKTNKKSVNVIPSIDVLLEQAISLHEKREYQHAKNKYEAILKINPKHMLTHHLLGVLLAQQRKHQLAIIYFKKALKIIPNNKACLMNLGHSYKALRKQKLALQTYEAALRLDPDDIEVQDNIQRMHYLMKSKEKSFVYVLDVGGSGVKFALYFDRQLSPIFKINVRRKRSKTYLKRKYVKECLVKFKENIWYKNPGVILVSGAAFATVAYLHRVFSDDVPIIRYTDSMAHTIGTFRSLRTGKVKSNLKGKLPSVCVVLGSGLGYAFTDKFGRIGLYKVDKKEVKSRMKEIRKELKRQFISSLIARTFIPMLLMDKNDKMPTIKESPYGKKQTYPGMKISQVRKKFRSNFMGCCKLLCNYMPKEQKPKSILLCGGINNIRNKKGQSPLPEILAKFKLGKKYGNPELIIEKGETAIIGAAIIYSCSRNNINIILN